MENTENTILSYVRENPVPLSLIGVGVGLLVWNARRQRNGHSGRPDPSVFGRSEVYAGLDGDDPSRQGNGGTGRHLEHLQDRVRNGVASVKHAATDTAHHAREQFGQLEHRAAAQAQRAKAVAERTWDDQPVVLGALALGVGLAVGFSIPTTESEGQLVGEYRDRLLGSVKDSVKEGARKLGDKAEQALHAAEGSLGGQAGADSSAAG